MTAGLCINPEWIPGGAEMAALRPSFVRSILYDVSELEELRSTGVPIFLTLNNECKQVGSDWSGWDMTLDKIGRTAGGQVFAVGCGNELDKYWSQNEDDVPPSFAANLVKRARPILRKYGIKTVATSVVSPRWQEYLGRMADLCREDADWFDAHLYGKRPNGWKSPGWGTGELEESIRTARAIAQRPIIMSEIGITLESAGGESGVPAYMKAVDQTMRGMASRDLDTDVDTTVSLYSWFAWYDEIGAPDERGPLAFGLRREDMSIRPAWQAFADINAVAPPAAEPTPVSHLPPLILAWSQLWQAVNPALPYDENVHEWGIPKYWRAHLGQMGSPVGQEITDTDGTVLQAFTLGVFRWNGSTVVPA